MKNLVESLFDKDLVTKTIDLFGDVFKLEHASHNGDPITDFFDADKIKKDLKVRWNDRDAILYGIPEMIFKIPMISADGELNRLTLRKKIEEILKKYSLNFNLDRDGFLYITTMRGNAVNFIKDEPIMNSSTNRIKISFSVETPYKDYCTIEYYFKLK